MSKRQITTTFSVLFLYLAIFCLMAAALFFNLEELAVTSGISRRSRIIYLGTNLVYVGFCVSIMMPLSCGFYQLAALNGLLETCIERRVENSKLFIKKVAMMYDKICDVFDAISAYFLLYNLIFLSAFYLYNVFFFYLLYVYLKSPTFNTGCLLFTSVTGFLYFAPCVLWMVTFSHWIQAESSKTADLVQKLTNLSVDLETLRVTQGLNLLVVHRRPRISFGLFDLNWKSFFDMLSAIFSFTIVAIQFYDVRSS